MSSNEEKLNLLEFNALKEYPDAKEMLRDMLDMAEKGEIIGVAFMTLNRQRSFTTGYTSGIGDHLIKAIGALECLKLRLLRKQED